MEGHLTSRQTPASPAAPAALVPSARSSRVHPAAALRLPARRRGGRFHTGCRFSHSTTGAACSAGGTQPSHVLLAMGESAALAKCGVRFSLGRDTTRADIDAALDAAQRALIPLLDPQPLAA